ncbi:unnamed protein product [Chrysodeixis includens]|uniref:Uncharacterized protein n=1 Tax=Chrysodeixis includens TaxID=689277 RepID=A0A9P0C323_CHRIL|nr:unnamed protein product [Chrysodeixis includens]
MSADLEDVINTNKHRTISNLFRILDIDQRVIAMADRVSFYNSAPYYNPTSIIFEFEDVISFMLSIKTQETVNGNSIKKEKNRRKKSQKKSREKLLMFLNICREIDLKKFSATVDRVENSNGNLADLFGFIAEHKDVVQAMYAAKQSGLPGFSTAKSDKPDLTEKVINSCAVLSQFFWYVNRLLLLAEVRDLRYVSAESLSNVINEFRDVLSYFPLIRSEIEPSSNVPRFERSIQCVNLLNKTKESCSMLARLLTLPIASRVEEMAKRVEQLDFMNASSLFQEFDDVVQHFSQFCPSLDNNEGDRLPEPVSQVNQVFAVDSKELQTKLTDAHLVVMKFFDSVDIHRINLMADSIASCCGDCKAMLTVITDYADVTRFFLISTLPFATLCAMFSGFEVKANKIIDGVLDCLRLLADIYLLSDKVRLEEMQTRVEASTGLCDILSIYADYDDLITAIRTFDSYKEK